MTFKMARESGGLWIGLQPVEMGNTSEEDWYIRDMWDEKIQLGYHCINDLECLMKIQGVEKLAKDIKKEIDALDKITPKNVMVVRSSNINRFDALVKCVKKQKGLVAVLQPYKMTVNSDAQKAVVVDIVCHINLEEIWIKVIAKNRNSLTSATMGDCAFGRRNIVDQARDFVELSIQNKYNYRPPKVIFHFDSGVDSCVANAIMELGIEVTGKVKLSSKESLFQDTNCYAIQTMNGSIGSTTKNMNSKEGSGIKKLNLDVAAMIAYVSELTNGGDNLVCDNKVLNLQAKAEQVTPLLPILNKLFEGRQLICCTLALDAFKTIIATLGGPNEKTRSVELIKRLTIVDDSVRPIKLLPNKKITMRSVTVFMTGEDHEAVTVTANNSLAQAAASQGQKFAVFIHEARSLTESKSTSTGEI